jgi:hypothetical protein
MAWINPLDKVPQVPVDWANHIVYGGLLGLAVQTAAAVAQAKGIGPGFAPREVAAAVVLAVAALKKTADYLKEGESWQMCVGKTIVTAVWPLSFLAASWIGQS